MVARPNPRTSLIAGVFVVAGVMAAVVIGFTLTDAISLLDSTRRYMVRFDLADGVGGVKRGSPVTLGGHDVGRVVGLRPAFEPAPQAPAGRRARVPAGMLVEIRLPAEMALYDNAEVRVQRPLIGTLSAINITDPGGPGLSPDGSARTATLLDSGDAIDGTTGGSIDTVIANAAGVTGKLDAILASLAPRAETGAEDLAATLEAARAFSERLDSRSETLLAELDELAGRALEQADRLPALVDETERVLGDAREGIADIRATIDNADGFITEGRTLLDDTGDDLRTTTSEAAELATRFNDELLPEYESRFDALLEQGRGVLGSADAVVGDLGSAFRELEPQVQRAAANLRLGTDLGLSFVDEIRAAPWRLLNRPGRLEQRRELLYTAARDYARAVSDLRATSASLEAAVAGLADRDTPTDPDRIAALRAQLTSAFDRYAGLEADLLDLLAGEGVEGARLPDEPRDAGAAEDGTGPG